MVGQSDLPTIPGRSRLDPATLRRADEAQGMTGGPKASGMSSPSDEALHVLLGRNRTSGAFRTSGSYRNDSLPPTQALGRQNPLDPFAPQNLGPSGGIRNGDFLDVWSR